MEKCNKNEIETFGGNIVLTGFMGTGKSTVGRMVAERLSLRFLDMDEKIEEEGMTIPELFAGKGEKYFRSQERRLALQLSQESGKVIATGGGTLLDEEVYLAMKRESLVICLTCSFDEILKRVRGGTGEQATARPLFASEEEARALFLKRQPLYGRIPLQVDTTGKTPLEVADMIVEMVRRGGRCGTDRTPSH